MQNTTSNLPTGVSFQLNTYKYMCYTYSTTLILPINTDITTRPYHDTPLTE